MVVNVLGALRHHLFQGQRRAPPHDLGRPINFSAISLGKYPDLTDLPPFGPSAWRQRSDHAGRRFGPNVLLQIIRNCNMIAD